MNGFPTSDGGLLVVSAFETLEESSGVVDRLQFYAFFDAADFVPAELYGDYGLSEYSEESSPFMV